VASIAGDERRQSFSSIGPRRNRSVAARPLASWDASGRRSRVPPSASERPPVKPSRAATSGNKAVPAREDKPVPSALTFTVLTLERPITFKVNLLSGGICASQP
jgi:hypothetical protein